MGVLRLETTIKNRVSSVAYLSLPDLKHFEAGDYNLYRYCHDDPINQSDPMGLEPIEISIRLDQLGIQASDNSLRASSDGYPRSQVIQEKNGQLSLQNKINEGVPVKCQVRAALSLKS